MCSRKKVFVKDSMSKRKKNVVFIYFASLIILDFLRFLRHSQDSPVWLGLTSREQLMSPECSKQQVLSFAKMLVVWLTNKKYSVLISVFQSAQWINSERIHPQTRVSSFPGLVMLCYSLVHCKKKTHFWRFWLLSLLQQFTYNTNWKCLMLFYVQSYNSKG